MSSTNNTRYYFVTDDNSLIYHDNGNWEEADATVDQNTAIQVATLAEAESRESHAIAQEQAASLAAISRAQVVFGTPPGSSSRPFGTTLSNTLPLFSMTPPRSNQQIQSAVTPSAANLSQNQNTQYAPTPTDPNQNAAANANANANQNTATTTQVPANTNQNTNPQNLFNTAQIPPANANPNANIPNLPVSAMSLPSAVATPNNITNAASVRFSPTDDTASALNAILTAIMNTPAIDPNLITSLGQSNIHTYRARFTKLLVDADMSPASAKTVVSFCMNMKNHRRLVAGLVSLPATIQTNAVIQPAIRFIENQCCERTNDMTKMPTVKIADSFPDICSVIYITDLVIISAGTPRANLTEDMERMVIKMWAASLALSPTLQNLNRVAVELEWNSWGSTSGRRVNRNNEVLAFNAEIYDNQVADKVMLMNPDSSLLTIPAGGYELTDLVSWAESWFNQFATTRILRITD